MTLIWTTVPWKLPRGMGQRKGCDGCGERGKLKYINDGELCAWLCAKCEDDYRSGHDA